MSAKRELTQRGFWYITFMDRTGAKCSLQESSVATEPCIWLGVDKDPKGNLVEYGRMHLTIQDAKMLVKKLNKFINDNKE